MNLGCLLSVVSPPRILIVDDDKDVAPLFGRILENAGYSVSSTLSGKEGLRAIRKEMFELVILDLAMPDLDGLEILQAVRDQLPKPKIIAVSGALPVMLGVAKKLGADVVLDKILATDLLVDSVRSLIEIPSCIARSDVAVPAASIAGNGESPA